MAIIKECIKCHRPEKEHIKICEQCKKYLLLPLAEKIKVLQDMALTHPEKEKIKEQIRR
jgi:hypothetical protein